MNKMMDIHNHTTWSDGMHSAEEIIENAIQNGVEVVGVSDHFDTIKCHSVPAHLLNNYIEDIGKLKLKYKDKIHVLAGIEVCMSRGWCNVDGLPYDTLNKLDYVLFEYVDLFEDSVTLEELKEYSSKITCKKGLAHTNLIILAEEYGIEYVADILKNSDLFWEINVNPGYEYFDEIINNKNSYYVIELFRKLKEKGINITVGSDTHSLYFYDIENIREGNELAQYKLI